VPPSNFYLKSMDILNKIISHQKKDVAKRQKKRPLSSFIDQVTKSERNFREALTGRASLTPIDKLPRPRLIAEIKKASPSAGVIRANIDRELLKIVATFNQFAAAISVITEKKFFQGSLSRLQKVRDLTPLPTLAKDFILDEYQLYEARLHGADAVLLIAQGNEPGQIEFLEKMIGIAHSLGMDSLVETHTVEDVKTALAAGAEIIGINNRDLATFKIDFDTTANLLPYIPEDIVIVSESGYKTPLDIQRIGDRVDAVLIGTGLLQSSNLPQTFEQLFTRVGKT